MTIDKTNAVTQSVANTAKRVIVIVGVLHCCSLSLSLYHSLTLSLSQSCARALFVPSPCNAHIPGVAIVLGESLDPMKLLGCAIGIGGVFLYSIIDNIVKPKAAK